MGGRGSAPVCLLPTLMAALASGGLWLTSGLGMGLGEEGRVGGASWQGNLSFLLSWVEFGWMGFGTDLWGWESVFPPIFLPHFLISAASAR